ncbi:MAG: hypothetical protein ACE5G7_01995 [Candidatus Hydrothermarchaeaceae archaeon]
MKAVADSAPLIYLAKIGRLELLRAYTEVLVPGAVYMETVSKGLEKGFLDAKIIQMEMDRGAIKLTELSAGQQKEAQELMKFAGIESGEAEAIVLAKDLNLDLLLDDLVAQGVAKALGLEPLWTTSFVLKLLSEKKLKKQEARETIEKLVGAGYRISEDVLIELLKKLE